jgi:hypothetical protein
MFLDGANVERLSKMIRKQANQAQFLVVSLRRPMIEAASPGERLRQRGDASTGSLYSGIGD